MAGEQPLATRVGQDADPVLVLRDVHVHAPDPSHGRWRRAAPLRVLAGLDLTVRPGQRVWCVGGSAGSDLLRLLAGWPEPPDAGRVSVLGISPTKVTRGDAKQLRTSIAVLGLPGPWGLVGHAERRRPVELIAQLLSDVAAPERTARAALLLDASGVTDALRTERVGGLGVEGRARVELAGALACSPALVLVDAQGLGSPLAEELLEALEPLREGGTAVLVSAATLPAALGRQERLLVLCGGLVVESVAGPCVPPLHHPASLALAGARQGAGHERPAITDPGCPFRSDCPRAQARCGQQMPPLVPPLGIDHPVACWFPDAADGQGGQEPSARDFAQG